MRNSEKKSKRWWLLPDGRVGSVIFSCSSPRAGKAETVDSPHCSYTFYCARHSFIVSGVPAPMIYGNEPYGETSVCQVPLAASPNGDPAADDAATIASHEVSEAAPDPFGTAWFTAFGNEIGDLCAYNCGTLTWDSSLANEMWNGNFYLLQQQFDNHAGGCTQIGP